VQPKEAFYAPLRFALASYGLLLVRNAFEAIRALNARAFDAYVLDYRLPDLSGVSLCRQIRQSDPNVPICFFTSSDGRDAKSRAARAGAQAYVSAPYDANALAVKLPALFQRVDVTSLHARLEEENVAHEEIRRRSSAAVRQSEQLRARASKLLERAVRVGAQSAFLKAGGNPGGLRARVAADVCRGALEAAVGRQRT
jgi:DNA-binding response OmpR family regulator